MNKTLLNMRGFGDFGQCGGNQKGQTTTFSLGHINLFITSRPLIFSYKDEGEILPIRNVGVEASGRIPSGELGLRYVAEVGNGRASDRNSALEPVQSFVDENNHKSVNLAL